MNQTGKKLLAIGMLVACAACATQGGGNKEAVGVAMADAGEPCAEANNERTYRNAFLRARHIGTAACSR